MKHHLNLLGYKVKDTVTEFTGVVTTISFDLYGCVQAIVTPGLNEEGKLGEAAWFGTKRLKALSKKPVMELPTFKVVAGGQAKPRFPMTPMK